VPRPVRAEEWQAVRDLRLRALADAPAAFGITLSEARQRTDDEWKQRLAVSADSVTLVEEGREGRLIGMASGFYAPDTRVAEVGGMFVEPAHRRGGVGRQLLAAVEAWALGLGATRIELEVNPKLEAALRL
jgi:GNAT superfamily N-acetyltransferase